MTASPKPTANQADAKPAAESAAAPPSAPNPPASVPPPAPRKGGRQKLLLIVAALVVLAAAYVAWPSLRFTFNTVSTDDAYVNGHVTFVAPRVPGQVAKVLVDDNYRVKKGDLLVKLDPEPYRIMVEIKQAAVALAEADLVAANAQVRGYVGQARANRYSLEYAIEQVNDQIAVLRSSVATLASRRAELELAAQAICAARKSWLRRGRSVKKISTYAGRRSRSMRPTSNGRSRRSMPTGLAWD